VGAALSIFVLLSLSVFVVRVASVALRLTGLDDSSARFQSLSAYTGTGFTTIEAEAIVNYPVRRKIISLLMIVGNVGLVGVFAALVASLVHTEGETGAVIEQLAWLAAGLALLWFVVLNKTADRALCFVIGRVLQSTAFLGKRRFHRLLQLGNGVSVCEHPVTVLLQDSDGRIAVDRLAELGLRPLGVKNINGELRQIDNAEKLSATERVVIYGLDTGHQALEGGNGVLGDK
jgi:uncharacterized membrane protein YuzA (DUF378 family)